MIRPFKTSDSNACNALPLRKISHSSARSGMLRKPALGKVLVALVLSCVIGAGVVGCNDNNGKASATTSGASELGLPAVAPALPRMAPIGGAYASAMMDIAGHQYDRLVASGKHPQTGPNIGAASQATSTMMDEDQKMVTTLLATLKPDPAAPLMTDQGNLVQEKVLEQFEKRKADYDKILAPLFANADIFAKASKAATAQTIQGYALSLVDPQNPKMVPGTDRKLADKLQSKLASYMKGIDPDAPNLGDVDAKGLTFGNW